MMANLIDEMNPNEILVQGRDTHVSNVCIPVTVGIGSKLFEIALWLLFLVPGVVFLFMKIQAENYFRKLEQRIQSAASTIDNYQKQRLVVLSNCARLVNQGTKHDQETFTRLAELRNAQPTDASRNSMEGELENLYRTVRLTVENYPELGAHREIQMAMEQNLTLQREITAARELYNDAILQWNTEIFSWPTNQIVAAKRGYTTRIPFAASLDEKARAEECIF